MGIRDSRHTVQLPRWGVNGETVDADVVEPPGAQKDSGWVPQVDVPVGEWWNWLHAMAYLFLAYLESILERRYNQNHVMRSAKGTTECQVSAGAGLSVNVVLGHVWLQGDMYEVPAATNLALAAADATNPRYDMIVARVTAGVPAYAVVTGTPAASPTEPAIAANEEAIARVRVNALAVAPTSIVDRRVFGRSSVAEFKADTIANLGDLGTGAHLVEVDAGQAGGIVHVAKEGTGFLGNGLLTIQPGSGLVVVVAEAVQFVSAIKRKFDIGLHGWPHVNDPAAIVEKELGGGWLLEATLLASVSTTVRVPNGATIKAVRAYGWRTTNVGAGLRILLYRYEKGSGVYTVIADVTNVGSGSTGNFTLAATGLSEVVDQSGVYDLTVLIDGAGADTCGLRNAEVEYEETKPFDGL